MAEPRDPVTAAEWQEAADTASFFLDVDAARQYGLITGGPDVDIERCKEILDRAAARGIRPRPASESPRG